MVSSSGNRLLTIPNLPVMRETLEIATPAAGKIATVRWPSNRVV
jgi:hypothetical protein